MGTKKGKGKKTSLAGKAIKAGKKLLGKDGGTKRRKRGVNYWANKVMVEKLKKKYNRLKFGGR